MSRLIISLARESFLPHEVAYMLLIYQLKGIRIKVEDYLNSL